MVNNKKFQAIQIYKQIHNRIGVLAKFNEISMKILASEIVARMLDPSHKEELNDIIKEIKIKKN